MKDREPKPNQEQKFISLRDSIIMQLKNSVSPMSKGGVEMARTETDGGTVALYLSSDGNWSGRVQMMGWPMGTDPSIESLLDQYAWAIGDKDYSSLLNGNEEKRMEYISKNREKLLNGLLNKMESTLQKLQVQN